MFPKKYLQTIAAAVTKRCGICQATVEQVLPAFIDEVRFQLIEGKHCVPIESFGTFALIDVPEREHLYTYKGKNEMKHLPACQRLKFAPTRNMRREIAEGRFDPSRRSFTRHPKDPAIRKRAALAYQGSRKSQINKGPTSRVQNP